MAWVLLDDNFPNHPKAVQAGPVAAYLFVCGLCYCRRYHTDGFIPTKALPALGLTARPARMVDALVDCGLWDRIEDGSGFKIHGYSEFYADANDKADKETRRKNGRKGGIESQRLNKTLDKPVGGGTGVVLSSRSSEEEERTSAFDRFWQVYPNADGKQVALKAWAKIDPDVETVAKILADVERRRRSPQWTKDGGQFIPHASTYLNQRRWEDGFKPVEKPQAGAAAMSVLDTLLGDGTNG